MTSPFCPEGDRGCLRLVLAVPFALLTVIAAFFCRAAVTTHPSGSWDRDAYTGIVLSCVLAIGAAGAAVLLWVLPSVRRVMPVWWVGPVLLIAIIAGARWVTST
ncbi:hypothetical protein ACGFW5_04845 [Streptomyces sp. NPDC048416]|uniref:hypothetical protein n=1 Tax=Streptomyces sp. NPDC048416 TaxID=3365546 RepID=UPI00371B6706